MRRALLLLIAASASAAHPMGNFGVNHYARLASTADGARLTYVIDLAEIPTFELTQQWAIDWRNQAALSQKTRAQASLWLQNLSLAQNGQNVPLHLLSVVSKAIEGAAGMPVLRVEITAFAPVKPGSAEYADHNYEGRAGWKEIVTGDAPDLTQSLTHYPADPSLSPPQDISAHIAFSQISPSQSTSLPAPPASGTPAAPIDTPPATFAQQQPQAAGTVAAGDYLSRLLQHRQIGLDLILFGMLAALGLGAMHALSPGHGKTIVAAYLVGSRGTLRHAGLLGFVVTFTHTFTVFLLGLGVLFFQQYVVPEKIMPVLGGISGLSIVAVGGMLLYRRAAALLHGHSHAHGHHHHHHHEHHHHGAFTHTHNDHDHSHDIPENLSLGSLIALGVSGGLVPCPSALILMLSAIALGRPGLGLLLLIAFSSGLAAVLMGIGTIAVYARHLLPKSESVTRSAAFQLIPIFSAVVVIVLGLAMTAVCAGWIQPLRFLA